MKRSAGVKHVWLERPSHLWQRSLPASCAVIYTTVSRVFMFFYAAGWDVATNKSSFSSLGDDLLCVFLSSCPHYSDGDTGSLALVPGGGLRACPTSFIMPSPIKRAAKLHCSGATPRKLSSLACHLVANCWSKGDKSCSPPLHALIALRERERKRDTDRGGERAEGRGAYFLAWRDIDSIAGSFGFWHRTSRAEVNGVSIGSEGSMDPETCSFITQALFIDKVFFLLQLQNLEVFVLLRFNIDD